MKLEDCEAGIHVKISDNIDKTHRDFSSNEHMYGMKGKIFKIQRISESRNGVIIGEYIWHPDDLIEIEDEKEKSEMIFHFNPEM